MGRRLCTRGPRGEEYYRQSHLPGAINLPLEELERAEEVLPNKEAEIVVYCMNTMRPASEEAARTLVAKGYANVRDYVEGKRGPKTPVFHTKVTNSKGAYMETQSRQPIILEGYEDLLESTALAHVATIGPHGEPQNNPVWFGWDGEHVVFSQTKARQKYRNLQRDPRVAFSLVAPDNPYRYLEIRGEMVRVEEDPNLDFINSMAKKYLGVDKYPYHQPGDERIVVFVRPDHTTQMGA